MRLGLTISKLLTESPPFGRWQHMQQGRMAFGCISMTQCFEVGDRSCVAVPTQPLHGEGGIDLRSKGTRYSTRAKRGGQRL